MHLPKFRKLRIKLAQGPEGHGPFNNPVQIVYEVELHRDAIFRPTRVHVIVTADEALLRGLPAQAEVVAGYVRYWLIENGGSLEGGTRVNLQLEAGDRDSLEALDPAAAAKVLDALLPIDPDDTDS